MSLFTDYHMFFKNDANGYHLLVSFTPFDCFDRSYIDKNISIGYTFFSKKGDKRLYEKTYDDFIRDPKDLNNKSSGTKYVKKLLRENFPKEYILSPHEEPYLTTHFFFYHKDTKTNCNKDILFDNYLLYRNKRLKISSPIIATPTPTSIPVPISNSSSMAVSVPISVPESLTVIQLKKALKEAGIKGYSGWNKDQLLSAYNKLPYSKKNPKKSPTKVSPTKVNPTNSVETIIETIESKTNLTIIDYITLINLDKTEFKKEKSKLISDFRRNLKTQSLKTLTDYLKKFENSTEETDKEIHKIIEDEYNKRTFDNNITFEKYKSKINRKRLDKKELNTINTAQPDKVLNTINFIKKGIDSDYVLCNNIKVRVEDIVTTVYSIGYIPTGGVDLDIFCDFYMKAQISNNIINSQKKYIDSLEEEKKNILKGYTYKGDTLINTYLRDEYDFEDRVINDGPYLIMPTYISDYNLIDFGKVTTHPWRSIIFNKILDTNEIKMLNTMIERLENNIQYISRELQIKYSLYKPLFEKIIEYMIKEIDKIFKHAPTNNKPYYLYRGLQNTDYLRKNIDSFYENRSLTSTTYDLNTAYKFTDEDMIDGAVLFITIPKNSHVLYLSSISQFKSESEVLLPFNSKFIINNVKTNHRIYSINKNNILTSKKAKIITMTYIGSTKTPLKKHANLSII